MQKVVIDKRYKILKKLGAGATGNVYKVKDLKNNTIIALKILSKEKTTSKLVQRFKREFRLLAELHHPNLCEVYNFGTLRDGRSYFTMEYIAGPNIFEFTQNPVRKDISNGVYPLIVQLCRVLEYIHSKGLIHYDIKPGNVLIQMARDSDNNTCVKLMDFGLAGEQRIKGGILIRGTIPYIAPEVIKGLAVDHRADLYSLGILLYELFTRKLVKVDKKESFSSLLQQSIQLSSRLPSKIGTDISALSGLERLIVRLINFEPAGRFSRANEIIKEINKITGSKFELETEKTLEAYLLSSRFVGRDKEMELLKSSYAKAQRGDGEVILVTGDAGIGKSRLLREFKIFIQTKRGHCVTGYASKDKIVPLEPFFNVFKELMSYFKEKPVRFWTRERKLWLAVLFRVFPELAVKRLKKNLPKPVPLDSKQEKLRTFDALTELITYCTSQLGEIVILLEDLHWADDLSIQFLEYLSRNLGGKNIFICGASRKDELEENLVFKKIITNLQKQNYLNQIELRPLKFRNLYSLLDSTITPRSNSSELTRYLTEKTGGNPFFVEEIMRTLLKTKGVNIGEKIEAEHLNKISIPTTIEDIVLERIKGLDQNSQNVLKFSAVLLKDFDYDLMKRLTEFDDTKLSKALWKLKKSQILIEESNRYRFYHTTLREAINKRMAYREKRKLYYQSGKVLEIINKRNVERVVEDLAYYFINAKDRKKGVPYGLRAARKSSERYANEQAIRFYKGVLKLSVDKGPQLRVNILQELAQIEVLVDYYGDAIEHFNKALRFGTGATDKKIKVYLGISDIYERRGEHNKELHIYQKVSRLLKKTKRCRLKTLWEVNINVRICTMHLLMGDYEKASKFNFDAVKFPKDGFKDKEVIKLQGSIYLNMGFIEFYKWKYSKPDYDKAIFYFKKAYRYYKKIRDEHEIAVVLNNLSVCYYYKFGIRKAFVHFQKAIQTLEKVGDQYALSHSLCNIGNILRTKGYYLKALNYLQRALFISKKIGHPFITGVSLWHIGDCFLLQCDFKSAKEHFEKALKVFHAIGMKEKETYPIENIGNVYRAMGDYTLALRFYRKALKISRNIKYQLGIALSFLRIGSVFIQIGEFLRAKKYIKNALKIAIATGEKKIEIECYIHLCWINMMMENYVKAIDYYKKGIKIASELGMRRDLLRFFLLASEIYYYEKKYSEGVKTANKSIRLAKEMGTKDLYAEGLLIKVRNEVEQGTLSNIEVFKILDKAKRIAEEIGCPEVLWKVYFEYGRFLQGDKQFLRVLEYYAKCHKIFMEVGGKIQNESYRKSYLDHPKRQRVFTAIREIKKLV